MPGAGRDFLTEQLELAEQLGLGPDNMFEPQDLPERFGRLVKAFDRLRQEAQDQPDA